MNSHTGSNIRRIREQKNITREDLSRSITMSQSDLENIEEQTVEPAVSDLLKIAGALGTDITALISGSKLSDKHVVVTRKEGRPSMERRGAYDYEFLASSFAGRHIEPFIIEVFEQPKEALDFSHHIGEEFHYVIEGTVCIVLGSEEHTLTQGDSIYFDSSLPHALRGVGGSAKILTVLYNGESMLHATRSKFMRGLIAAAKHLGDRSVAVVCPGKSEIEAVNAGVREGVIKHAYLIGDLSGLPQEIMRYPRHYKHIAVPGRGEAYFQEAAQKGTALVRSGDCQMLMKGQLNTALFVKAVLHEKNAITTGRRLSLTSIFELPDIDRLIFLTDPGINPALVAGRDLKTSIDIITNAIDVANALGVVRPKVALLEANEMPSDNIPASRSEQELAAMPWNNADVYGPLSYDLALYREVAIDKGMGDNPVAGKADILVVPYISGGNFLYKAWAMTMNADVANVVLGAKVPIMISSRSDTEMTKFLTICVCAVYSQYQAHKK